MHKDLTKSSFSLREWLETTPIIVPVIAVILAFAFGALFILATGHNPIQAYILFIRGAFGNTFNLMETITKSIPLTIAGLAFLFAYRCGVFNIGTEGQLLIGAIAAALVGFLIKLPPVIHQIVLILTGAVFGALYAGIAGWLKAYRGVNEILSTLMLNYPAIYLTHFLVVKVFKAPGVVPATPLINKSAELPVIIPDTRLHAGIFIVIGLIFLVDFILRKTVLGYEIRAVGFNPTAAAYSGISIRKNVIIAIMISGALAGIAGSVEVMGLHHRFFDQFSPGYGFDGISVSLVALLNPFATFFSALFFGAMRTGSTEMQIFLEIPRQLMTLYQGIILFFIAGQLIFITLIRKIIRKRKE